MTVREYMEKNAVPGDTVVTVLYLDGEVVKRKYCGWADAVPDAYGGYEVLDYGIREEYAGYTMVIGENSEATERYYDDIATFGAALKQLASIDSNSERRIRWRFAQEIEKAAVNDPNLTAAQRSAVIGYVSKFVAHSA